MATIISTKTSSVGGLSVTGDASGILQLASADGTTAVTIDASQNVTFARSVNTPNTFGFKNRIINGGMVIDQRNAGTSVTPTTSGYNVDRWVSELSLASKFSVQQNAGGVTPPVGFSNYLGVTSLSAYSIVASDYFMITQYIEGYNIADLGFGTASASPVTLSFQVRSSLTGIFGGALTNGANNYNYPFSYSIPVANTWTTISIPITGATSGTWLATNGQGLTVNISLGMGSTRSGTAGSWQAANLHSATGAVSVVGTSGATFYITGVQLEKGSVATSFDQRAYSQELAMCQRYYWRTLGVASSFPSVNGQSFTNTANYGIAIPFPVQMRSTPTVNKNGTWAVSGCNQPVVQGVDVNGFYIYAAGTGVGNMAFSPSGSTTYLDTSGAEL
jgi:hypothetical protein